MKEAADFLATVERTDAWQLVRQAYGSLPPKVWGWLLVGAIVLALLRWLVPVLALLRRPK